MPNKDFVTLADYSPTDILALLERAAEMKAAPDRFRSALAGKTLGLIFEKPSTRTRVSFEVGIAQLGGTGIFLGMESMQLSRGESVPDTARVLSRFVDGIVARVRQHATILELARYASIPVINGLSDLLHPCQALADFLTLRERRGTLAGRKLAYVGDGNNVCHELMLAAAKLGVAMSVATPDGYAPMPEYVDQAQAIAAETGAPRCEVVRDARAAVKGADVVYTDVWISMGQEAEAEDRRRIFRDYAVTEALMAQAGPEALFMHCLPAHRGEEVAAEVIDGPRSVVFDEAENRLHTQKALLALLMGQKLS